MKYKLSKKSIALTAAGAVILAGVGIGVFALGSGQPEQPAPTASETPTAQPTTPPGTEATLSPEGELQAGLIERTAQHIEGSSSLVAQAAAPDYISAGETFGFPSGLEMPAVWTVQEYIDGAIRNPYFASDWWGTKDNYNLSGPQNHFYKTLTPELQEEFTSRITPLASGANQAEDGAWLASRMFRPNSLTATEACYDTWEASACWTDDNFEGITVESTTGSYTSATTMELTVKFTLHGQYVHPALNDGSVSSQDRIYEMKFSLEYANAPSEESLEEKTPYMLITAIESNVTEGVVEDYLLVSELPPPPPIEQ